MDGISQRYQGDQGRSYYDKLFSTATEHGRLYQCRYFQPYCGPDRVVLDLGCADGLMLRQLPARRHVGVEVNAAAREACEAASASPSIPFDLHASLDTVDDASIDVAYSNHVLEHVQHPYAVLEQLNRVLKPGGVLVLVTPFDDWRQGSQRRWTQGDINNHLYTWSPMNIGNLVHEAGFVVETVDLRSAAWHPRLTWIDRTLGKLAFRFAGELFGRVLNRREIVCIAKTREQSVALKVPA